MKIDKNILKTNTYNFLNTNPHLGNKVIFLGLSGSISYGTNNENSDIDLRGVTLNRKSDLIGLTSFEQYVDDQTDTCIYGFNKMIKLLINCNPNTIELLGLNPEHYLYLSDIGKELIDKRKMFLSKVAIQSFGGYASAQLRRLQNALARDAYPQPEKEKHILDSINHAMYEFKNRYRSFEEGSIETRSFNLVWRRTLWKSRAVKWICYLLNRRRIKLKHRSVRHLKLGRPRTPS